MATMTHSRWRAIALCMGFAAIFWLFNALNKDYTTTINYPIRFIADNTKQAFIEAPPSKISLEVTGRGWNLLRYLLHVNVIPVEIPVAKVVRRGQISRERVYILLTQHLKDLKVNQVMTDTLRLQQKEAD